MVSVGIRRSGKPVRPVVQFFAPIVFTFCYGVTDEVHQLYLPFRSFEYVDLVADALGATAMQTMLCMLWYRADRRTSPSPDR